MPRRMDALDAAKGEDKDPKCLKCHTIGYGTATGYDKAGRRQAGSPKTSARSAAKPATARARIISP